MINWTEINKVQLGLNGILALVVFFLVFILYVWHRDSKSNIDLKDLICTNNRIDEKKFVRFGAWIVSTWGFVYLIVEERFSEWYFAGYMAAWVGNALIDKYISNSKETKEQELEVKQKDSPRWKKYD
jgi:Na+/H+ antiporter NhaD/arsenite permease-like protein